jgi:hypothetical protein
MKEQVLRSVIGQSRQVLWEDSNPTPDGKRRISGYTEDYLRVSLESASALPIEGSIETAIMSDFDPKSLRLQASLP